MDPKEQLLNQIAAAEAKLVELSEDFGPEIARRFVELLNEESERVAIIWEDGGCPLDITLDVLWKIPAHGQTQAWRQIGENLIACASIQADTEINSIAWLKGMEKHAKRHTEYSRRLNRGDVRSIAKVGPGKARFDGELKLRRDKRAETGTIRP
jgi:hypothetical protein